MRLANTFCATKRIRRSNMFCATKAIRRSNRFCAMTKFSSRKQMSDETFLIALIFLRRTDVSATSFAGRIFFCRANISAPNKSSSRKFYATNSCFVSISLVQRWFTRRTLLRDEVFYLVAQRLSSRSLRDGLCATNFLSR